MARPRKPWRYSEGRRGETVAIYEPRVGAALRWDYRDAEGQRRRPWVDPPIHVRHGDTEPVDPLLEKRAIEECRRKYHEVRGQLHRRRRDAHDLTVTDAFAFFHDPRDGGMPKSRSARTHHEASRDFWEGRFGGDCLWNDATPNITEAALQEIIDDGMAPTARKRHQNLRTVYNWLRTKMRLRGLEDPTLGVDINAMTAHHEPRRPRYTKEQVERMVEASADFDWRVELFVILLADQGGRGIQARELSRRHLDPPLDNPPPPDVGPHGYIVFPAVKGQKPRPSLLTKRARDAIDRALAGPLAEWEAAYQDGEMADFPLLPGGRIDRDELTTEPITDTAIRKLWPKLEQAAKVPSKERRGFHGARRMWGNVVQREAGSDAAAHAGGWADREVFEESYLDPVRWEDLERARRIREGDG